MSKQVYRRTVQHQRHQLQVRIHRWMEVPLAVMAIVMVILLVIDLSNIASPALEHRVQQSDQHTQADRTVVETIPSQGRHPASTAREQAPALESDT